LFLIAVNGQGHYCEPTSSLWCLDWIFTSIASPNDTIQFTITAQADSATAKWVALGLNNQPEMAGAHAIVSWVKPGTGVQTVSCRQLIGTTTDHDSVFLPKQYATAVSGSNTNGVTKVTFNRPVILVNDVYGIPTILNAFTHGLWAIGPNAPATAEANMTMHLINLKGTFAVNFFTGQTMADFTPTPTSFGVSLTSCWALLALFLAVLVN